MSMLRGGPYSAAEEIYLMQAEEATDLRADMREMVNLLRDFLTQHYEMAENRLTADHQIIEAIVSLTAIAKALESVARGADLMPDQVQAVIGSDDVMEIHKKLADALTFDICTQLDVHLDAAVERFANIAARIERNVNAAVLSLRDANAGKPSLPPIKARGTVMQRLWSRAYYYYIYLLRLAFDMHHLAVTFASVSVGLAAVAILIGALSRIPTDH